MNGIDRRAVLRHGFGVAAVLGASAGLVALKALGTGAPEAPEPVPPADPVLEAVRERLAHSAPGASGTP
jgi:hypothetical protein